MSELFDNLTDTIQNFSNRIVKDGKILHQETGATKIPKK